MKKRTLRIICLLACLAMLIAGIPAVAFASSNNRIYANEVMTKAGDTIEIPICISGNSGFMGISVVFSYDSSLMTPISVNKGNLITSGLFDDSIGTTDKPEFKVIWCGSDEITKDGEICKLKFKINDDASSGNYKIKISYESKNTFDKNYKTVKLNCDNITVNINNDGTPVKITLWQKIVKVFNKIINWIKGIFVK